MYGTSACALCTLALTSPTSAFMAECRTAALCSEQVQSLTTNQTGNACTTIILFDSERCLIEDNSRLFF